MQMMTGVDLSAYPKPIVDVEQSARTAKEKVFAIKKSLEERVSQKSFSVMGRDGKGSVGPLVWFYKR